MGKTLKERWKIQSNFQLAKILLVFALTGTLSARLSAPLLDFFGLHRGEVNPFIYWPLYIILILPVYKVLIIIIGWLFGEYRFFFNFVKKMLSHMGLAKFLKKPDDS
ncbi:MAG: diacylglyceryl transferase [Flavobacteriales bacterium CG_4_9_14_3_um_filter_40_17]|nr:MAG: diacylglyceryl transferase [Flavobacteriales bacterium CG_4_9_14_3_um_filter_40_17]